MNGDKRAERPQTDFELREATLKALGETGLQFPRLIDAIEVHLGRETTIEDVGREVQGLIVANSTAAAAAHQPARKPESDNSAA